MSATQNYIRKMWRGGQITDLEAYQRLHSWGESREGITDNIWPLKSEILGAIKKRADATILPTGEIVLGYKEPEG